MANIGVQLTSLEDSGIIVPNHYATLLSEDKFNYTINFFCEIPKIAIDKYQFLKISISKVIENSTTSDTSGGYIASKAVKEALILEKIINLSPLPQENRILREYDVSFLQIPGKFFKSSTNLSKLSLQFCNLEIIDKLKIDPSDAINDPTYFNNYSFVNKLRNYYLFESINSNYTNGKYLVADIKDLNNASKDNTIHSRNVAFNTTLDIPVNLVTTNSTARDGQLLPLTVAFILQKANADGTYDETSPVLGITLNISNLRLYKNEKIKKPLITNGKDQLNLLVEKKSTIKLQKKSINSLFQVSNYVQIYEENLSSNNKILKFLQPNSISHMQVYRCIVETAIDSSYKNVIFGTTFIDTNQIIDQTFLEIVEHKNVKGLDIVIKNSPNNASEFSVFKKKYIPQTEGFAQEQEIKVSKYQKMQSTNIVADFDINNGDIYEYFVRYKMDDGLIIKSFSKIHLYNISNSLISSISATMQTPLLTIGDAPDEHTVLLNFNLDVDDQEVDIIKRGLIKNNFYQEFSDEFKRQLNDITKIKSLLFFKIHRINLSAHGDEEEFDKIFVSDDTFFSDDKETRFKNNISNINLLDSYKYQIKAYLKNPLTLLTNNVFISKPKIDQRTGRTRKISIYKPYKWFQKSVLRTGTLLSENSNGTLNVPFLNQDEYIGVAAEQTMSKLSQTMSTITNCNATRLDKNNILIKWDVDLLDHYDHFVIVKESAQQRNILTTTHKNLYLDEVSEKDAGIIYYYIIPVYANYDVSTAISTSIVIDPREF